MTNNAPRIPSVSTYSTAAHAIALVTRLPVVPVRMQTTAKEFSRELERMERSRLSARDAWRCAAELIYAAANYAKTPAERRAWLDRADRASDACTAAVDPRAAAEGRRRREAADAEWRARATG